MALYLGSNKVDLLGGPPQIQNILTTTKTISDNGTYTAPTGTAWARVTVDVDAVDSTELLTRTVDNNGTYIAPTGSAYSTFIVAVPVYDGEAEEVIGV